MSSSLLRLDEFVRFVQGNQLPLPIEQSIRKRFGFCYYPIKMIIPQLAAEILELGWFSVARILANDHPLPQVPACFDQVVVPIG